jgi:hypothetical protein
VEAHILVEYCSTVQYSWSRNRVEAHILVEYYSTIVRHTLLVECLLRHDWYCGSPALQDVPQLVELVMLLLSSPSPGGRAPGLVECCSTVQHYTLLLLVEKSSRPGGVL